MTNKLRDELAIVALKSMESQREKGEVDCRILAQAIIDHLAPTMREVVEALEYYKGSGDTVANNALTSLSEWQEKGE